MMDSARKESRNRQWDKAIGEARADIEAAELDQERRLASLAAADDHTHTGPQKKYLVRCWDPRHKWRDLLDWAAQEEKQRKLSGFDQWRGVPLETLQNLTGSQLEELSSDRNLFSQFYGGDKCSECTESAPSWTYSKKKLRSLEWSLLRLVIRLLSISTERLEDLETSHVRSKRTICKALSWKRERWKEALEDAQRRLEMLRAEDEYSDLYDNFPSPMAPQFIYSPCQREDELHTLNIKLQAELMALTSENSDDLSTVCSHLLILRVAPNVHTYNLLLVRFCQLRKCSLVHAVLDSMVESHVRPNEVTHATLLRFYANTNDARAFRKYRLKMGGWEQGLALADPGRKLNPISLSQFRMTPNGKIYIKARMNEDVYASMIIGSLKLRERGIAKRFYEKMVREGWQPTVEILEAILKDCCLGDRDIKSGLAVWELLLVLHDRGHQISLSAYESMIKLWDFAFDLVLKKVQALENSIKLSRRPQKQRLARKNFTTRSIPPKKDLILQPPDQSMNVLVISERQDTACLALYPAPEHREHVEFEARVTDIDPIHKRVLGRAEMEPSTSAKEKTISSTHDGQQQDILIRSELQIPRKPSEGSLEYEISTETAECIDVEAWVRSNPRMHGPRSRWVSPQSQDGSTGRDGRLLLANH